MMEKVNYMDKKRCYNLDLMRFVCMLMIVSLHYFGEGGIMSSTKSCFNNMVIANILVVLCRGAVNCFYMNSGYFLSEKENISFNSSISLYKQISGYSILIFFIAIFFGISKFSFKGLLRAFFPIIGNQYWFATVFIIVSLLRPYLGLMLSNLKDNQLWSLLFIFFFYDSIQAVFGENVFNELGNGFLHAISMVIFGYSIKRFDKLKINYPSSIIIYVCSAGVLCVLGFMLGKIPEIHIDYWHDLMVYNSILIVLMSYGIFNFFLNVKIKKDWFSKISGSIFSIYLIQDHSTMRENFWIKIMKCDMFYDSKLMLVHYFFCILIIAFVCIAIDLLLRKIFRVFLVLFEKNKKMVHVNKVLYKGEDDK